MTHARITHTLPDGTPVGRCVLCGDAETHTVPPMPSAQEMRAVLQDKLAYCEARAQESKGAVHNYWAREYHTVRRMLEGS